MTTCLGYVCGTAVLLAMLVKDGEFAMYTAGGCALAMFGAQAAVNAVGRKKTP